MQIQLNQPIILFINEFIRPMNEFILHDIWLHQSFLPHELKTHNGQSLSILNKGHYNYTDGPDFRSAQLSINQELITGDIEIHVKSSEWYHHKHHKDSAYNNVILHVVYTHDKPTFNQLGMQIPTLILSNRLNPAILRTVLSKKQFLCSGKPIDLSLWQDQSKISLIQRYDKKRMHIETIHRQTLGNDWWLTSVWIFLKAFLGNHNGENALVLVKNVNKRIVLSCDSEIKLISYLLGIGGWLEPTNNPLMDSKSKSTNSLPLLGIENPNILSQLKQYFEFIKSKYQLKRLPEISWNYKQVRPHSFPEIRLLQFASWLYKHRNLMDNLLNPNYPISEFKKSLSPSEFNQFTPPIGEAKKNDILINGFILLQFCKQNPKDAAALLNNLLLQLPAEKNKIAKQIECLLPKAQNALNSQQLISQFQEFCLIKRCLSCQIGSHILGRTSIP